MVNSLSTNSVYDRDKREFQLAECEYSGPIEEIILTVERNTSI